MSTLICLLGSFPRAITIRSSFHCLVCSRNFQTKSSKLFPSKKSTFTYSNVALLSTSSAVSSSSSVGGDFGPLNIVTIAEELAKFSNADKSGTSPIIAGDSVSITDIDLTEFTAPIDPLQISESLLTATDVGLTWFAPTNLVFKSLMAVHEQLPWWGSIAVLTVCLRILLFPVMVRNMKAASIMSENVKAMELHRSEFRMVMQSGDQALQVKAAINLLDAMKKNQLAVMKSMLPMLAMGVVFSSNFFAIRAMANYPIESMKTEGLSWFIDLTLPDPFYVLPLLTSTTLYYVIISGNETVPVDPLSAKMLKIMPFIICPVVFLVGSAFPAALNTYWLTNNLISLGQGFVLRKTKLRSILQIPDPAKASKEMSKGALHNTLEMQKDIQAAAAIVKQLYQTKMTEDIKKKTEKLRKD